MMVSSATSGVRRQTAGSVGYAALVDVREYAGTGFGGESAHVVRLDFQVTPGGTGTTGSTSGSTSGTTGSTTGSTTSTTTGTTTGSTTGTTTGSTAGSSAGSTGGAQANAVGAYRVKPRAWMMRRRQSPLSSEGAKSRLVAEDMVDVPPSMQSVPATAGGTAGTTGSTTSTTGSTGGGTSSVAYFFGVEPAYGTALTMGGSSSGRQTVIANASNGTSYTVTGFTVPIGGAHFEYRLPPSAVTRKVYYVTFTSGTDSSGNPTGSTTVMPAVLALSRRDTPCVSIDSRDVYGQPNLDGELPGDPNADLRNVNFSGWSYKGGLFVGNAPSGSGDQSGTARIQAYVPPATFTQALGSSVTFLALGRPSKFPSAAAYKAYVPSINDLNLNTLPATVTWKTGWSLSDATAVGTGDDLTGSFPSNEYSRCFFTGDASRVLVALSSEATIVSQGGGCWQYFSSPGYEAQFPNTFPVNDSRPRTWTVDCLGYDGGTYFGP